jgi:hypothetical protein
MLTLLGAKSAAASAARGGHFRFQHFYWPLLAVIALALSGCVPTLTQVATADPTDPAARATRVGYRSTVAPHTSLRPATPAPWQDRNDAVTPQPKQDR